MKYFLKQILINFSFLILIEFWKLILFLRINFFNQSLISFNFKLNILNREK